MAVTQWQLGEIHTVVWKLASLILHWWQKGYWPMCSMYSYIQTGSNCVVLIGDNVHNPFVMSGWEGLHYLNRDVNDFFCVIFFSPDDWAVAALERLGTLCLCTEHTSTCMPLGALSMLTGCLFVHVGQVCGEDIVEDGLFHIWMPRLLNTKLLSHLTLSAIWGRIPNSPRKYFTKNLSFI